MYVRVSKSLSRVLALTFVALMPIALSAQVTATSTGKTANDPPSKWDIFAGYSALIPNGDICCYPHGKVFGYNSIDYGAILSITRFFNKNVGVRFEGDEHILLPETNITTIQPGDDFSGGYGGVVFRIPTADGKVTPSFHFLAGAEQVGSIPQTDVFGFAFTAGGSLDVATPAFDHHLSIRLFQADYQYMDENYGPVDGGAVDVNALRLSAGLVFHVGSLAPPPPVTLTCSANPTWVYPGDPITVTATAGSLNPKEAAVYAWSGNGVTGNGTTATVATGSLAPGSYDVKATVTEGKGDKPYEVATCTASFTVKAFEPPTVSCSANPSTIKPGDTSTITAAGQSPQNRPLTYSYSTDTGTVTGTDTTATFNSTGAAVGAATINCNVADDKGGTATATATVTIAAPYVAPVPHTQALCSITFEKDPKRPDRVDNDAKACLDEVALDLQKQTDAAVVVVGDSTAVEKTPAKGKHAKAGNDAAQRAVNTKDYLVTEKGIDASRITVKTGTADAQEVQNYLVPAGADFATEVPGTTAVDESVVKPQTRKALPTRPEPKKKAAKQ